MNWPAMLIPLVPSVLGLLVIIVDSLIAQQENNDE